MIDKDNFILDQFSSASSDVKLIVDYYEKYRLAYNVLVGISGLIPLIFNQYSPRYLLIDLILIFIFGALANVMYTMGWASHILANRYLGETNSFYRFRLPILVSGTLFSMLFSFLIAAVTT